VSLSAITVMTPSSLNLGPAVDQYGRFLCDDGALSAEWFGPKDALNRSSLVFQTEYRKSITLLLLCAAEGR